MAILKTAGRMADRMQIGTGVKFALGENPKSVYNDGLPDPTAVILPFSMQT